MKRLAVASCIFYMATSHAQQPNMFFDGGEQAFLSTKHNFFITVLDQVKDGCLPRPSALKDKLEISLRRNGFLIESENKTFASTLVINALGYESGINMCAVSLRITIEYPIVAKVHHTNLSNANNSETLLIHRTQITHNLLTGPKTDIQERLENVTSSAGDNFFLMISRARDKIFTDFPEIKASFDARSYRKD